MEPISYLGYLMKQIFNRKTLHTAKYNSIYDIDYSRLNEEGIKLIIFDIDDTIMDNANALPEESLKLLKELSKAFQVAILSNRKGRKRRDILDKTQNLPILIENSTKKPHYKGFLKLMNHFNKTPEETAMVGDRVGMDLWGAYLSQIKTRILVEPYSDRFLGKRPSFIIRFIRGVEKKWLN